MAEAGLGPAEVGEKIAEHREHAMHQEPTGRDRTVTIIEAALLAMVALMAAWSGFASAKWSTASRLQLAAASTARTEGIQALDVAAANKEFDSLVFNAWFGAYIAGNIQGADVAERLFRPEFAIAFNAWIAANPFNDVDAPRGPTYMPEYKQPELEQAHALDQKANALAARGAESAEHADRYVRITVFLATVLFLVGISGHFTLRLARYGLIATAVVILLASVALLVTSPWPPS